MTTDPSSLVEQLLSLPGLSSPVVSPDRKWLAWSWFNLGPAANVYLAPIDGSRAPVQLTDTDQDTLVYSWSPDSRALVVGEDRDGDERVRLFRIDIDQPENRVLLNEEEPPYFIRGGSLHPNLKWLVYGANYDFDRRREIEIFCLYRQDLETEERKLLAQPKNPSFLRPRLNRWGDYVLYTRSDLHPAGEQVWIADIEGEEDRELLNFGADRKISARWHPDSRRVIFLADHENHRRLGICDYEGKEMVWLIDDPERNIETAFVPKGAEDWAVVLEIDRARVKTSFLHLSTKEEVSLDLETGNLIPYAPLGDDHWVGRYYSATDPDDVVVFSPQDLDPTSFRSLTGLWEKTDLDKKDLAPADEITWSSVDGREIQGWLFKPSGEARGTIVHIHGGPTAHIEDEFHDKIQALVAQGFQVLAPNYRGSTGFGLEYQESIKEDGWGGREQDDIRMGIQALFEWKLAQPGKVGVTGTSYGGYSSWCQITRYPRDVIAGAAPICGMTDLVIDYETTRPDLRPYSEEMMGGTPKSMPEKYRDRSPIHFVNEIEGKVLVVQGMKDPNVTPDNARKVTEALKSAGVEFEELNFDDEGHGICRPENLKVLYQKLAQFFGDAFAEADRREGD